MKTISRISGAIFAVGMFATWGIIGAADMGDFHPGRLAAAFAVTAVAGLVYIVTRRNCEE